MRRMRCWTSGWRSARLRVGDPSDATQEVIRAQQASRDPLSEQEQARSRRIDTHDAGSLDSLVEAIRQHLPGV